MERFCPDAWLIESANPVFEGTTLLARGTKIKVVELCHGYLGYRHVVDALGLDLTQMNVQMADSITIFG
jgi:alpha-galactosidase